MGAGSGIIAAAMPHAVEAAPGAPRFSRVLFDSRFAEARSFAHAMGEAGSAVRGFAGDVTSLWFAEIAPLWEDGPAAIAGMTTPGPLFCLERWAWEAGMRVQFRIDHVPATDGAVQHLVAQAVDDVRIRQMLDHADGDYPARVAQLLLAGAHPRACCASSAGAPSPINLPTPLVTWMIAPRFSA